MLLSSVVNKKVRKKEMFKKKNKKNCAGGGWIYDCPQQKMTDTCSRAACADSYRHLWSRKLNGYGRSYPRYSQVFAFYQGGYAIFTTFALNHTSVVKSYMKDPFTH